MTFTATGRSTAHTKCRNEVEDLERSGELCGRAVADNFKEAGKHFGDKDELGHLLIACAKSYAALLNWSFACTPSEANTLSMRSVEMSWVLRFRMAVTRVRDV
jgi:hypothetical protein